MWVVDTLLRVAPILLFLAAVTALAELADAAGVFDAAARLAGRRRQGSLLRLWLLLVLLATATTVLLALETTAVLLTPVVLALDAAGAAGAAVRPSPSRGWWACPSCSSRRSVRSR